MRITNLYTLAITLLAILVIGCGKDDSTIDPEKFQLEKLRKTWTLVSATIDGEVAEQIESNFTLIMSGTYGSDDYAYVTAGANFPNPWPATGTWTFVTIENNTGVIKRDDNVDIEYSIAENGQLTLRFQFSGEGYDDARTKTVGGLWVFVLE